MGATSSSAAEGALGREPSEMVRPMAPSRGGFMESQGAGMAIFMTARLALAMGCPIHGIVALSSTATDKNGRSVPAPGQGILTSARETVSLTSSGLSFPSPSLDPAYRKRRLASELARVAAARDAEAAAAAEEAAAMVTSAGDDVSGARLAAESFLAARLSAIHTEAAVSEAAARRRWCADWWRSDPTIAPLRGALATWGLGIDDVTVATFHGTGTHANDVNESEVTHLQMAHLGRTPGLPVFVVAQKHLTGHPKGAAAAWMMNGALQMLTSGVVPGNVNCDDVDSELRRFSHLAYVNRPLRLGPGGIKAVVLKSFGFGQAGGEVLLVHPDYLLAALTSGAYDAYATKRADRERIAYRHGQDVLSGARPLVGVKAHPPYTKGQEQAVYLTPTARVRKDDVTGEYSFHDEDLGPVVPPLQSQLAVMPSSNSNSSSSASAASSSGNALLTSLVSSAASSAAGVAAGAGLGADVEPVASFAAPSDVMLGRNFTPAEVAYCAAAAHPPSSFAGRWAAKEAVVKALCSAAPGLIASRGSGAPLAEIEIVACAAGTGAPSVALHGALAAAAARAGIVASGIKVTISHADGFAVAVATVAPSAAAAATTA